MFGFRKKKNTSDEKIENKRADETIKKNKIDELTIKIDNLTDELATINAKEKKKSFIEVGSFIILLVTTVSGALIYLNAQFSSINNKIDDCLTKEDIEKLESDIKEIDQWIKGDINDQTKPGANKRIEKIEEMLNISPIYVDNPTVATNLLYTTSLVNKNSATNASLSSGTYLGQDATGKKYFVDDAVEQNVLLTYNEGEKEVYFFGHLNSQYHWDGYCVTNTYNDDGTLYGICESNFDDGNRLDYESFYLSDTKDVWIHTDRICTQNNNQGTTEKYSFKYNNVKNFTNTNARIYDFLYIKNFSGLDEQDMITYYYGFTSDGEYNDQSGDAYEIILNPDGTVKTLYMGQFKNGVFHDQTENAEEIVFDSYNGINKYFYYKGTFTQGNRDGEVSEKDYVTQEQINEIIKNKKFGINLNWYNVE